MLATSPGIDVLDGVAADLRQRGHVRGDDRRAGCHRLEHRQAEALARATGSRTPRSAGRAPRAPRRRRSRAACSARRASAARRASRRSPSRARRRRRAGARVCSCSVEARVGVDQPRQVLARLERADGEHEAGRGQRRLLASRCRPSRVHRRDARAGDDASSTAAAREARRRARRRSPARSRGARRAAHRGAERQRARSPPSAGSGASTARRWPVVDDRHARGCAGTRPSGRSWTRGTRRTRGWPRAPRSRCHHGIARARSAAS